MEARKSGNKFSSRMPIFLSALVYPGLGQLVQRRWLAGILFLLAFTVAFVVFMWVAGGLIVSYYRMGFEFETYEPDIHPGRLLPAFLLAIGIYIVNLLDVALAHFRRNPDAKHRVVERGESHLQPSEK